MYHFSTESKRLIKNITLKLEIMLWEKYEGTGLFETEAAEINQLRRLHPRIFTPFGEKPEPLQDRLKKVGR